MGKGFTLQEKFTFVLYGREGRLLDFDLNVNRGKNLAETIINAIMLADPILGYLLDPSDAELGQEILEKSGDYLETLEAIHKELGFDATDRPYALLRIKRGKEFVKQRMTDGCIDFVEIASTAAAEELDDKFVKMRG